MSEENTSTPVAAEPISIQPGGGVDWDTLDVAEENAQKATEAIADKQVAVEQAVEDKKATPESTPLDADGIKEAINKVNGEISGDAESIYTVKVDGQEEQVSLEELKRNYSGKVVWEKKYSELDVEKQKFHGDVKAVDAQMQQVKELCDAGKGYQALDYLATLTGADPEKLLRGIVSQSEQVAAEYADLTDTEREQKFQSVRIKSDSERLQKQKETLDQQQKTLELNNHIASECAKHGVSQQEFGEKWKFLNEQELYKDREVTSSQIVADVIAYTHSAKRFDRVGLAAESIDPKLAKDEAFIRRIERSVRTIEMDREKEFTVSDIESIIRDVRKSSGTEDEPGNNGNSSYGRSENSSTGAIPLTGSSLSASPMRGNATPERATSQNKLDSLLEGADDGSEFF